ncbi:glycosyltransferase [Paenibacillus glycanilyticus]|uniref:glycosyltransferase family 2 protein n=1 Tax=Paenibacillus glycanilyticus TaxID=126569 RepID=UPI00203B0D54|nr:glycosyltransferase family 2 protein [Paenibacillus glycanilyticus]MCM3630342.1 glycosyltransferase [Paenibacillus glycanilyticus]
MPKITVLMPVYNAEKYLREAIDSILSQTFSDFELLIINDGSTDNSETLIRSYSDKRIRLINNDRNMKLVPTLNKGINLAKGEYIARMDSDDISHPHRLETQLKFMEEHQDVVVCGTKMKVMNRLLYRYHTIVEPRRISNCLCVYNCMVHPSIMLRTNFFRENNITFDNDYLHAEDYELFQRISRENKVANINKALLYYRLSPSGISRVYKVEQQLMVNRISSKALKFKGINIDLPDDKDVNIEKLKEIKLLIESECDKFKNHLDNFEILQLLWFNICSNNTKINGLKLWRVFHSFKFLNLLIVKRYVGIDTVFKFYFKTLINN